MSEYARLVVAVDSRQVPKATSDIDKMSGAASRLEGVVKSAGAAVIGMVSIQAIRSAQRLSEQFVLLEARVRRMSGSAEEAEITYSRLADVARKSGADMVETVRLWESLTGTLRELGANDSQVIRLTETLQKIGAVGSSSAEEMSNALRQLGQGLAGGTLRAEEFNAIIEGMPELAREIARGIGIPFGELRQQMQAGELTAERVLGAIQNRAMEVDAEFAKLPRTVSQASAALTNDLGGAVAQLDKAIGGSANLAAFLGLLAKGIRLTAGDLTDVERLNELAIERAKLQERLGQAERRTLLSAKERATFDNALAKINEEMLEIQNRRIDQQKEESETIQSNGKAQNEQYDKYLARLAESAALQGENSEAAKVRYAIETGELGKLLPEQEAALLQYAEEIDAKREAGQLTEQLARSNEQLQQSYTSAAQAIERQLSLYGATSEAAKVRYEIESGAMKGIAAQKADYLISLARELDAKRELAEQDQIEETGNRDALSVLDSLRTEEEAIRESYERRRQIIMDATLLTEEQKNEAVLALKQEHDEQMIQANGSYWERYMVAAQENLLAFDEMAGTMLENFTGRFGDAFESMVFEAESFGDALQGAGQAMARSVVNAIGEMAAQWVAYQALEMAGIAKTTAAKTASVSTITAAQMGSIAATTAASTAATATTTATQAAAAATTTAAWTPAAIVASIGSFGGAAAIGLAAVLAALAFTGGFRKGGYTGNGGVNDVAGVVHGKEYVFDAESTARIGVANLEAMRNGEMPVTEMAMVRPTGSGGTAQSPGVAGGTNINVNLIEDASKAGQVEQVQSDDGTQALTLWVSRIRAGGNAESAALEQAYGLSRVGR